MAQLMCEELCVGYDGKAVLKDLNLRLLRAIISVLLEQTVLVKAL